MGPFAAYLGGNEDYWGSHLVISTLADTVVRQVEAVGDAVSESLFEPVIRLGVTGLARAGKTVFITSLIANLMDRGRMGAMGAVRDGRIEAAFLQPQPDDTVPRFAFEAHLGALTSPTPFWPESTRMISELRLSLRVRPSGMLSGLKGPRTVHLDIVDYPGEWLLDLALLDQSYDQWSEATLARISQHEVAQAFVAQAQDLDATTTHDESVAQGLALQFTDVLHALRAAGVARLAPGRFLLPGDLEGSPALTFAPLPDAPSAGRGSLHREMQRRFEAYKSKVVKPFFRDHFARIDRQIVLVDALSAIHNGPAAVEDMRLAMEEILSAFNPGKTAFLTRLLGGRRVEKILFAATKADHLHHSQHDRLSQIMQGLVRGARDRADFAGASTQALALASLRATTEEMRQYEGAELGCVRGILPDGRSAAFYPGALPQDAAALLGPAREGAREWLGAEYQFMSFQPQPLTLKPGDGPPHIRLDRAAEFLIGDRL